MPDSEAVPKNPDAAAAPRVRKSRAEEQAKIRARRSNSQGSIAKESPSVIAYRERSSSLTAAPRSEVSKISMNSGMRSPKGSMMRSPDVSLMKSPDVPTTEEDGFRLPKTINRTISADLSVDDAEKKGSGEKTRLSKEMAVTIIPKSHYRTVDVIFDLDEIGEDLLLQLSYTMVVRHVGRESPLFSFLLVGDQILEVNHEIVWSPDEFNEMIAPGKITLTVIRPWNTRNLDDRLPVKYRKDSIYSLIEVHRFSGMKNGFELKQSGKKCTVTKVPPKTRGAFAFFKNDRILDVDSQPVSSMDIRGVRKKFNDVLAAQGKCSFLVERDHLLKSSTNASLCNARALIPPEPRMGDDASEIGAREATRFLFMKNRYQPKPILKDPNAKTQTTVDATTDTEEDNKEKKKKKKKRTKKKKRKLISLEGKNEYSRMPSDVTDPSSLQKVTSKSGLLAFVRTIFK